MNSGNYPLVSIVFLNFNGQRFVNQWRPLFSLDYPNYEIIFVDNGSQDGSEIAFAKIANEHSHVKVKMLKLRQNCGYSKANNCGVKEANGEYLVLLSNDIKVTPGWLKNAIEVLKSDERIGVAQSMMYELDNPAKQDQMGNYIDVFGMNHPYSFFNKGNEVFYCEGAVMFIRRKAMDEACGLFDGKYFMFYEDIDFCWRVRLMGYRAVVIPKSIVYHKRGGTVSGTLMKTEPIYVYANTKNRLNTLFRNYSRGNVIRFVPLSTAIEILKGLLLMFNGRPQASLACFRGIFAFVSDIPDAAKKRSAVQTKRKISDTEIQKYMIPTREAFKDIIGNVEKLQNEWTSK